MVQYEKLPKGVFFLISSMIYSKFGFWQMGPYSSEIDMNYRMEKRLLFWSDICFSGWLWFMRAYVEPHSIGIKFSSSASPKFVLGRLDRL